MKKSAFIVAILLVPLIGIAQLYLGPGSTWRSNSNTFVVLSNTDLKYDATAALLENIFKFTGNTNSAISGNTTPIFTQIQVAKTSPGNLLLQNHINVTQSVTFQSGIFDLTNYNVNLGTNAVVNGENETNRFIGNLGEIIIIPTLNAPSGAVPGNLGARITSSANLGNVIIRRGHKSQTSNGVGSSILRYYNIEPVNNTALNATLRFFFLEAELNGLLESSLTMWKSNNNVEWQNMGFTNRNTVQNWVELSGINDFSRWTLSSPNNPLPVSWTSFTAGCNTDIASISWKTLQENNSHLFIIERSSDAVSWLPVGTLTAAGNSSNALTYRFNDRQPFPGTNYYRIIQQDNDGHLNYSPVLKSNCRNNSGITIYPTITNNFITIKPSTVDFTNKMMLRIFDTGGRLLLEKELQAGLQQLSLAHLPAGLYLVEAIQGQFKTNIKIIRQ